MNNNNNNKSINSKKIQKNSIKPLQISYPCFISPTIIAFAVDPSVNWLPN